jgi:hypothetical protein
VPAGAYRTSTIGADTPASQHHQAVFGRPAQDRLGHDRVAGASSSLELMKEGPFVPRFPVSWDRFGSLAHHRRDERREPHAQELANLDSQHFRGIHLGVQELHDTAELRRDLVRDKHEPKPASLEIGLDLKA